MKWAIDNEERHPAFSMFCHGFRCNLDYIFYSPKTMRVKRILEIPTVELVSLDKDLPSKLFPSDHLRMQTEFEVYFSKHDIANMQSKL